MTRRITHPIVVLTSVLLVACADTGADEASEEASTPMVQVAATHLATVDSALVESGPILSGTLVAERTARLRPQTSGTIISLAVRPGTEVRRGQLIAVIDTMVLSEQANSARLALRSAELSAVTADRNDGRSAELYAAGAISERDREMSATAAAQASAVREDARSRLASAMKQLDNAIVRAPFAGIVADVPASVGDAVSVNGGGVIAVVVDPSLLEIQAGVPANNLEQMRPGSRIQFAVPAYRTRVFEGVISRVAPAVDPATGQVVIYARVPNPGGLLAVGLFVEGRVSVNSSRALTIPFAALDLSSTVPSVRRVRGGVVESIAVDLGVRDELLELIEVVSGLGHGDTVLVAGAIGTPLGSQVRVTQTDS